MLTFISCFSGEAFDILRGTWFYESSYVFLTQFSHQILTINNCLSLSYSWQPVQCEYADRIEHEHLQRFLGHKMADYVWDVNTSTRIEKQVGTER